MSFYPDEPIPCIPIHFVCRYYRLLRVPVRCESNEKSWRDEVSPLSRWRILALVEFTLLNSFNDGYVHQNRKHIAEVAYIVEKLLIISANSKEEYVGVDNLPERVNSAIRACTRHIVQVSQEARDLMDHLYANCTDGGEDREWRMVGERYNRGAGAA